MKEPTLKGSKKKDLSHVKMIQKVTRRDVECGETLDA